MTITVSTPDGGTAEFPDGTPQGTMESALQAKFSAPSTQPHDFGAFHNIVQGMTDSALSAGTLGLSDRAAQGVDAAAGALGLPKAPDISQQEGQFSSEHPLLSATGAALGYGMGFGKLGVGEGVASRLGGGKVAQVLGGAAEGAAAGAGSDVIADPSDPLGSALRGATAGGVLGGAGAGLGLGANKALQAGFGKAASVDPAAAIAQTKAQTKAAYDALGNIPIQPGTVMQSIGGAAKGLDPSEVTGLSGGFKGQVSDIQNALNQQAQAGNNVHAGMVDSWQRQINQAASTPTDTIAAGKMNSALDGVLQAHGAGGLQDAAQNAYKQSVMAENLAKWQSRTKVGASPGMAPLNEAEKWYPNSPEQYSTLEGLYKQSQGSSPATYALGHMAANAAGTVGGMVGGFPGAFIGEGLGYLFAKPAVARTMKGVDRNALLRAYQAAYPAMTGIQPTGGKQAPQVGNAIKNLMIGSVY